MAWTAPPLGTCVQVSSAWGTWHNSLSGHVYSYTGGPGYDDALHVCGMCGMLFETSYPLGAKLI